MEQDFARQRIRTPLAEPSPPPRTSGFAILMTGVLTGVVIGLFIGLLVYMGGLLPPPPGQPAAQNEAPRPSQFTAEAADDIVSEELAREAARLQLEFYRELPNYEVVVDVTPVNVPQPRVTAPPPTETAAAPSESPGATGTAATESASAQDISTTQAPSEPTPEVIAPPATTAANFMLQAGAFQQQQTATAQLNRLLSLGMNAQIRQENLPGRTLYLVQAGPYATRDQMLQAEQVLRRNNIDTMRITLSQP